MSIEVCIGKRVLTQEETTIFSWLELRKCIPNYIAGVYEIIDSMDKIFPKEITDICFSYFCQLAYCNICSSFYIKDKLKYYGNYTSEIVHTDECLVRPKSNKFNRNVCVMAKSFLDQLVFSYLSRDKDAKIDCIVDSNNLIFGDNTGQLKISFMEGINYTSGPHVKPLTKDNIGEDYCNPIIYNLRHLRSLNCGLTEYFGQRVNSVSSVAHLPYL